MAAEPNWKDFKGFLSQVLEGSDRPKAVWLPRHLIERYVAKGDVVPTEEGSGWVTADGAVRIYESLGLGR